jgi:hypothetical protein
MDARFVLYIIVTLYLFGKKKKKKKKRLDNGMNRTKTCSLYYIHLHSIIPFRLNIFIYHYDLHCISVVALLQHDTLLRK